MLFRNNICHPFHLHQASKGWEQAGEWKGKYGFREAEQVWHLQYCPTQQVTLSGSDMIFTCFSPGLAEQLPDSERSGL